MFLFRPQEFQNGIGEITAFVPLMPVFLILAAVSCLFEKLPSKLAAPLYLTPLLIASFAISTALTGWAGGAIEVISKMWIFPVQLIIASLAIRTEKNIRHLFILFCAMSVLFSIHGIQQIETTVGFSGVTLLEYGGFSRIRYAGVFKDPNDLGLYFLVTLPMFYYLFSNSRNLFFKFVNILSIVVVFIGIYYTNSRGTIVGLAGMLALVVTLRRNILAIALGLIVALAALALGPSRIAEIEVGEESAWQRVEAWYEGLQALRENPLFGIGLNGFTDRFVLVAHNSFVQVFSELGIVGYTIWLAIIYVSFRFTFRPKIIRDGDKHLDIAGTLSLSLTGFMFAAFFITRSFESLLFILVGMCCAVYHFMPNLSVRPQSSAGSIAKHAVMIAVGSIVLLVLLNRFVRLLK
jgi:putative inorganic carbon (hco3(-)) transporter